MRYQHPLLAALIQVVAVAAYFFFYFLAGPWVSMIFAGIFVVADLRSWPGAFRSHLSDEPFVYLSITVLSSAFAIIASFANAYEIFGVLISSSGAAEGLWPHFYFSVVTFTTLGYGDYVPSGTAQYLAAVQAVTGFFYFAFIVGVSAGIFHTKIARRKNEREETAPHGEA